MEGRYAIAIAGTHGKTTTTALVSFMLVEAGLSPTFLVGGDVVNLGTNAAAGRGRAHRGRGGRVRRRLPQLRARHRRRHEHRARPPRHLRLFRRRSGGVQPVPEVRCRPTAGSSPAPTTPPSPTSWAEAKLSRSLSKRSRSSSTGWTRPSTGSSATWARPRRGRRSSSSGLHGRPYGEFRICAAGAAQREQRPRRHSRRPPRRRAAGGDAEGAGGVPRRRTSLRVRSARPAGSR